MPHRTEADCLKACKQGACCDGVTCTVKPECQCQGAGQEFKGVGTLCTPNPCLCCTPAGVPTGVCKQCWCFCGEGKAVYPRFINVTMSGTYKMFRIASGKQQVKEKSFSASITLAAESAPSKSNCPRWIYGINSPLGTNGATGSVTIDSPTFPTLTSAHFGIYIELQDFSEGTDFPKDWMTAGTYLCGNWGSILSAGIQTSGTCFSDIAVSFKATTNPESAGVPDSEERAVINGSITGVQA